MTRQEVDRNVWETNYQNKSVSGIEVRDKNGKVVHFIAINHEETLHDIKTHRIAIKLDENGKPMLPQALTFDEMIQAKRRQQMLLYGSGATSSSATSHAAGPARHSNGRTASAAASTVRRAAAATKRAKANLSRRSAPPVAALAPIATSSVEPELAASSVATSSTRRSAVVPPAAVQPGKSRSSPAKKKSPPKKSSRPRPSAAAAAATPEVPQTQPSDDSWASNQPASPKSANNPLQDQFRCTETMSKPDSNGTRLATSEACMQNPPLQAEMSQPATVKHMITSMKELNRDNPALNNMDPREIKKLVRRAAPGTNIILPNGTLIKKSRRGGARAGAGRKRSRRLPSNEEQKNAPCDPEAESRTDSMKYFYENEDTDEESGSPSPIKPPFLDHAMAASYEAHDKARAAADATES